MKKAVGLQIHGGSEQRVAQMRHVEIILKVAERCNLNCTYCYFFNKENKDFENNPALISMSTIKDLVRFLRTSPHEISETTFQIDIHGGEPLLLGVARFSEMLTIIKNGLHDAAAVNFTVQTNAVLIDEAWLEVFSHHQVYVGISIDGPKFQHDANRIDKRGRGTFDRMVPKISMVRQGVSDGNLPGFGAICVVSPESDARATYMCLTHDLGIAQLQFLFPDDTHDSVDPLDVKYYEAFVDDLFDCWENDTRKSVRIELIDQTLQGFLQENVSSLEDRRAARAAEGVAFTVSSAGDIGHDDTLRNVIPDLFNSRMNVAHATFAEFLSWYRGVSKRLSPTVPIPKCASCTWRNICEHVTNADTLLYRMKNGVADQPSIYCEALQRAYFNGATYLAKRGVSIREISKNLTLQ